MCLAAACRYAAELTHTNTFSKKGVWLVVTMLCISMSGVLAYTLPFFSILMAVIASVGDVMSMFGLPCLFALLLLKLTHLEKGICRVLLVLAVGLTAFGIFSSVQQLIEAYHGQRV